jgi:hypothetical protein
VGWLIAGILVLGAICGLFNAWRAAEQEHAPIDDDLNHSEGEDDHVE